MKEKSFAQREADAKRRAQEVLAPLGLTLDDAIRILFFKIARDHCFPVELLK